MLSVSVGIKRRLYHEVVVVVGVVAEGCNTSIKKLCRKSNLIRAVFQGKLKPTSNSGVACCYPGHSIGIEQCLHGSKE